MLLRVLTIELMKRNILELVIKLLADFLLAFFYQLRSNIRMDLQAIYRNLDSVGTARHSKGQPTATRIFGCVKSRIQDMYTFEMGT